MGYYYIFYVRSLVFFEKEKLVILKMGIIVEMCLIFFFN